MHRIHHPYGRRKNNYGDIAWWGMLLGTRANPVEQVHTCGFDGASEQQLLKMLAQLDREAR
jgi:sterol desaturase/sphingolipid hydroxylase (fatty acid hydroxylase superfamily)